MRCLKGDTVSTKEAELSMQICVTLCKGQYSLGWDTGGRRVSRSFEWNVKHASMPSGELCNSLLTLVSWGGCEKVGDARRELLF